MYWPIAAPRIYAATSPRSGSSSGIPNSAHQEPIDPQPTHDRRPKDVPNALATTTGENSAEGHLGRGQGHDASPSTEEPVGSHDESVAASAQSSGDDKAILGLDVARHGQLFATLTNKALTVWQTRPTAVLAKVVRSTQSIATYGSNLSLLLRPDAAIFVVQTSLGYLITYSLATDPEARVYRTAFPTDGPRHSRRQDWHRGHADGGYFLRMLGGESPFREISLRFRMAIKVDAGITSALALDDELVVATRKPAAVQCIRWSPDSTGNQTSTELVGRMSWLAEKTQVAQMAYDKPMGVFIWITSDGGAHSVQKSLDIPQRESGVPQGLFKGYSFHRPQDPRDRATSVAVNARFSLIAVGTASGAVHVYHLRDYTGNIPLSHQTRPSASPEVSGSVRFLSYSPDGYCLFTGLGRGWTTNSVFGKPGGCSFSADRMLIEEKRETWLGGVRDGRWIGGGSELLLAAEDDDRLWVLEFARSAIAGCFSAANVSRSLLLRRSAFMVYRGYDLPDLTSISAEATLWHTVQLPDGYLYDQGPIRSAAISPDGRYVAVAGRRGLAHYSIHSGRWKTFENPAMGNEFSVRGGMCWHHHILVAAVETDDDFEVRLYSRELALDNSYALHVERLQAPVVHVSQYGVDSLLVYTYENILYHYVVAASPKTVELVRVGQIAFHGIIRAPARVRAISWVLPENQLDHGDPSQDVTIASVLFLVDGKLALLQPSVNECGERKYDMRILAHNVEYYVHLSEYPSWETDASGGRAPSVSDDQSALAVDRSRVSLRDSLWMFDGQSMHTWTDVQDLLRSTLLDAPQNAPVPVQICMDFYPVSVLPNKGITLGIEPELIQRQDVAFAFFRIATRTQLFLPQILRHHLAHFNSPAALHLSHQYQQLLYFPHALEVLLHNVLDEEAEQAPPQESALLPSVLSFLSSFPQYLDILVQCTRKTEVRSWRTLFAHLPPPQTLFEESLERDQLKTAGGYLLVLHTFEELEPSSEKSIRLFSRAKEKGDWELCKELARFLMSMDESGRTLREAAQTVGLAPPATPDTFLSAPAEEEEDEDEDE